MKLTESLPNQRVETGHSCTKTAEARGVTITAEMLNDNDKLDSMNIDYVDLLKLAFLTGKDTLFTICSTDFSSDVLEVMFLTK